LAVVYPFPSPRVRDLPSGQQPRELVDRLGTEHVTDDVLLAVLLRTGLPRKNVLELARDILHRYETLTALARAPLEELVAIPGLGRVKAQTLLCALELARRLMRDATPDRPVIRTPGDAARLLRETIRLEEVENFWVLLLDTRFRLIGQPRRVSKGILDASLVHPREVFRDAVRAGSAAVLLAHNHPSGDLSPSGEDLQITRRLVEAGKLMEIDVLDHVILAQPGGEEVGDRFLSLRESGLITF
jgi:DNA repair protein RadC